MPEPTFRSTDGHAPGKRPFDDSQAEIPTEPGFTPIAPQDDIPTEPGFSSPAADSDLGSTDIAKEGTEDVGGISSSDLPTDSAVEIDEELVPDDDDRVGGVYEASNEPAQSVTSQAPAKGGCASTIMSAVGLIAFVAVIIIALAISFLVYYRPGDTTF